MTIQISEESYFENDVANGRKIVTSSSAFGILRQQLVRNIGITRMKDFLFHYGWEMGVNDAKEAKKKESSVEALVKKGPLLHIANGHITGMKHDCDVEYDENNHLSSVYGRGVWINSYEAAEHVKRIGLSETPVCHTLIGYASGYMSTVFGEPLFAREIECVGKGDSVCRWEVKTQKQWENEKQDQPYFYNEIPIVEELEVTYEQLLDQQKFVTKLSSFQTKLAEEIANGSDLQSITDMVFSIGRIPIIISDTGHRTLSYSGLSEEKYTDLKEDMNRFFKESRGSNDVFKIKENQISAFRRKVLKTEQQERLITPILVQKEVIGFCSFIYENSAEHNYEEDFLFLDRFSNAVSIVLLNEKTKFESFERMKGNFLEQILDAKLQPAEMIKRGRYTGIDLTKRYYITVMEYKKFDRSLQEEFLLHEQIFETTFWYFNEKKYNLLIGNRDGNMVLFISEETFNDMIINDLIKDFQQFISNKYPQGEFKFGISNVGEGIENAPKCYEEAMIALRLTLKKGIVPFQSLGIIGVLIDTKNIKGIKMIAEQELGPLYHTEDAKIHELLKTLYFFLLNGGKLEQTMSDLALSMSGLRHRIVKIESMLNKDLRDPNETHQLLLIIKSLIALGDLNID
ncbi:V4R domain-containing protein [Bacillus sp. B15-48]|uniref:XylR N-terminal domain-containing protein n=1 Tax=Bacillus sp. B15-48 TaxID=1548601 RepID=UPI00193F3E4E|nr:V4R domain-containing protein [Bacillus sp. B15-48]MBM4760967.1 PucR family transcriptional regulator [Bacillus sp. B15-48]